MEINWNIRPESITFKPMHDLEKLTNSVRQLAKEVGKWIRSEQLNFQQDRVEVKDHNSLVSYVDKKAESKLVEGLSKLLPEAGFITEEDTVTNDEKEWSWIIDPLDGTTNFIHGLPIFAVSIGLMYENEIVSGVVYECGYDECFSAWKGGGAWCNGKRIQVSTKSKVEDSLFATGFPYYDFGRMKAFQELLEDFFTSSRGLRRLGSAATDLAWVACGRFEGFFEYGLSPWDVAGGAIIVKEAGGSICDFKGEDDYVFGQTIISAADGVFEEFRDMIKKRMN